jgi:hypothetical protein
MSINIDQEDNTVNADSNIIEKKLETQQSVCDLNEINKLYLKKCGNNKELLITEEKTRNELAKNPDANKYLYPSLDDPLFNIKISEKKEFNDTKYDGTIYDIKEYSDILSKAEFELLPQQAFVRNFLSFQTPYNSLLLFHGLGSGKTCSAIGVCEEMREYLKQMGINKKIIIVASPNVQDNFKLQLFDERKLKLIDGNWTMKGCLGNKLLKEINPTRMKGLTKEKVIQLVKNLIRTSYSFQGYIQFSNYISVVAGNSEDNMESKIRNLQRIFSDSLIVIDEVHNIRISDDNENKNVAKNLMFLVSVVNNLRLLLLSATPMFNSYKEIVWLLNLMNMNDKRGIVSVSDIFTKTGEFRKDEDGKDSGKELLIRKATGYISYVRGENPYTFPFRVFPDRFSPNHTFSTIEEYPKYQLNGRKIPDNKKIQKLSLYLTAIGDYQKFGYKYIINKLRSREERIIVTKTGKIRKMKSFSSLKAFGYTDLQLPIESLNIIYPYEGLDDIAKNIENIEFIDEEEEPVYELSIDNDYKKDNKDIIEEIDDVISNGPELTKTISGTLSASELESEPVITEGIEADEKMFDKVSETESKMKISSNDLVSLKSHTIKGGSEILEMDPKDLTGTQGLKRVMDYIDSKTPAMKGNFEYNRGMPKVFSSSEIGKYSSKIKTICDSIYSNGKVSDGIILIYSSFIDGGIIPMALALEEMGFTRYGKNAKPLFKNLPTPIVDSRTMKEPISKKDFKPARYIMITGDNRISPNNDYEMKAVTSDNNLNGEEIKVVLITQAGSEGLDFKALRQVHIMDPWYNINRIEQIIGRAVRNFSHKDLPFEKRNVEIFLHGTILENSEEEAVDLYVYRIAELKAITIGKVTRLLKQTAVDCIINHDQIDLIYENFKKIDDNLDIEQVLSDHQVLKNFEVGDMDDSPTCDFMKCQFDCLPSITIDEEKELNYDTYNEAFMLINSDKIIQKIKNLMKVRFFYSKQELLQLINIPKKYPLPQIYSALTQVITDGSEYLVDKYGRTGYLVNIGDYYLFQPSEITNNVNISVYDRSVPIDYKHNSIKFEIKSQALKPVVDKRNMPLFELEENEADIKKEEDLKEGQNIFTQMFSNYKLALETSNVQRGDDNWYLHCGVLLRKLSKDNDLIQEDTVEKRLAILEQFLIEHIVDTLMMNEKISLMNYLLNPISVDGIKEKYFLTKIKEYLMSKIIVAKGIHGIILFDGPSRTTNLNIFILDKQNKRWIPGQPEDKRDLEQAIVNKYAVKLNMNKYVGFIGFETNKKYMVYKIKDTENTRSTGFRCDQSGKIKIMKLLNEIENDEKYVSKQTKDNANELCVRQEFTLRYYNSIEYDNFVWFVDTETAIINEFEKKEK